MPGPVLRLAGSIGESSDFSVFESCDDDLQESLRGVNGNFSAESIYHDCNKHEQVAYRETCNGEQVILSATECSEATTVTAMETAALNNNVVEREIVTCVKETRATQFEGDEEDLELEDELLDEAVETINMPVVEASLSVDLTTSLTRQKICSVHRGRTLSFVDKDDGEEPPTRRACPLAHASESIGGSPVHSLPASHDSPKHDKAQSSDNIAQRITRVSRNPSYHFAVRDATVLSPKNTPKSKTFNKSSRSCDNSPSRTGIPMDSLREENPAAGSGNKRHVSESDEVVTLPLASNIPRSVSYSGPESLSLTVNASGTLSEGNSRSGSTGQLSANASQSSSTTLGDKSPSPNFTRGSAITRSFRRLFSTPNRPAPAAQTAADQEDIPSSQNTTDSEVKSSRLRKLSTSLSRKLSTRSKMSASSSTNGQPSIVTNGTAMPEDVKSLIEYEDLLKLFCCSGCQTIMTPPLHQCRKGHLVCSSCRFSLKQACPTCKQRFADSTNMMMEQVCQLVKFPCKYAAQGCPEFHRLRAKQDHEHFCSFRPVHCHHGPQGCSKVLLMRDMHQHLEQCEFKHK